MRWVRRTQYNHPRSPLGSQLGSCTHNRNTASPLPCSVHHVTLSFSLYSSIHHNTWLSRLGVFSTPSLHEIQRTNHTHTQRNTMVQSPAVATQHLRPAGLEHVIPTTASARPVLQALPCGEQAEHHVTRTNEARPRDWGAERAFAPGSNPTLASALGRPRRSGPHWAAGDGVAQRGAAIEAGAFRHLRGSPLP